MKYNYLPYNKTLKDKASEMRNNMTAAEKKYGKNILENINIPG